MSKGVQKAARNVVRQADAAGPSAARKDSGGVFETLRRHLAERGGKPRMRGLRRVVPTLKDIV